MRRELKIFFKNPTVKFFTWLAIFFSVAVANTTAEVKFEKAKIKLGNQVVSVEIAKSFEQQARGLMFKKKLAKDTGMLFIYDHEQIMSFWMKNTFIPLSIGFFNQDRVLVDVQEMEPVKSEMQKEIPSYKSRKPARYALEMPAGWFKLRKVNVGTPFNFIKEK